MIKLIKLLVEDNNVPKYSYELIESIGRWMDIGTLDTDNVKTLLQLNIPAKFKKCNKPIYRVMSLNKDDVIKKTIGSWTTDLNIAKEWTGNDMFTDVHNENKDMVIFKIRKPNPANIVFNTSILFNDENFLQSIDYYNESNEYDMLPEALEMEDELLEVCYIASELSWDNAFLIFDMKTKRWIPI